MGLTWAAEWAVGGVLIGVASTLLPGLPWGWFFEVFDAPLPALAVPGFFGGVFFSIVLGIAGRGRRFRDLSLPLFVGWGMLGGVLLTLFPLALAGVGLASLNTSAWTIVTAFGGPCIVFSAASAFISLTLARRAEHRELAAADDDLAQVGLTEQEARELLGAGESPIAGQRTSEQESARHQETRGVR